MGQKVWERHLWNDERSEATCCVSARPGIGLARPNRNLVESNLYHHLLVLMAAIQCLNCHALFAEDSHLRHHLAQKTACKDGHFKKVKTRPPPSPSTERASIRRRRQEPATLSSNSPDAHISPGGQQDDSCSSSTRSGPSSSTHSTAQDKFIRKTYPDAGKPLREHPTIFEMRKAVQKQEGLPPWAPFVSKEEWEFAEWIIASGISQDETDKLLKSGMRQFQLCVASNAAKFASYRDNKTLLKTIDLLPGPATSWKLIEITVKGDMQDAKGNTMTETLDVWARNPVEVVAELLGNPEFKDELEYAPAEVYMGAEMEGMDPDRLFEEMSASDWWNRVQTSGDLPKEATIAPVILASDKTQLSTFSGDKVAWPVYLTIGNIKNSVRRRPSRRAMVLLGYLPVSKLSCFRPQDRSLQGYRLFHFAMQQLLSPLVDAGKHGVEMVCADGLVRLVFPILAAYLADYPEQCLICCNKENRCPTCVVPRDERGELVDSCYRDPETTLAAVNDPSSSRFDNEGLRHVPNPFWMNLPHANIFNCITPDLLHQLHKGVFKDHLVKWTTKGFEAEVDSRFMRVPPYINLRAFKKGISSISQWTGNEFREMEKIFVCILCGLHEDSRVITATRAILDFIYLAHYPSHSTSTLEDMQRALETFHSHKQVFVDLGVRSHFNIQKIHWMKHYVVSIIDFGSCDGLSTEISERLHIDFAKQAYRASNRKAYIKQMILWLLRREKVRWMRGYIRWNTALETQNDLVGNQPTGYDVLLSDRDDDSEDEDLSDDCLQQSGLWTHESVEVLSYPAHPSHESQVVTYDHTDIHLDNHTGTTSRLATDLDDEADLEESQCTTYFSPYRIARRPGLGFYTAAEIVAHFGAVSFEHALKTFLQRECPTAQERYIEGTITKHPYAVFKQFSRVLPSLRGVDGDTFYDRIRACPSSHDQAAYFSTVLYVDQPEHAHTVGLEGYRVGQVRVIFSIPPSLQRLRADPTQANGHLAYVELFTPFTKQPEPHSKLYKVARSFSGMTRRAVVMPLTTIFRSCHLMPDWGGVADKTWSADTILEECEMFYLNPFSDHHMYIFV
ncbi:hypothetical protein A0H81_01917, partial [Grifola frondosa]